MFDEGKYNTIDKTEKEHSLNTLKLVHNQQAMILESGDGD